MDNFSAYQLLEMMTDSDFAFLSEYTPEAIDTMCIALTIELHESNSPLSVN
jgi:hypothetical protein